MFCVRCCHPVPAWHWDEMCPVTVSPFQEDNNDPNMTYCDLHCYPPLHNVPYFFVLSSLAYVNVPIQQCEIVVKVLH